MANSHVTVVGNLVEDPELKFTSGGNALTRIRVAVNRRRRDKASGEWIEETDFITASCWAEMAENVATSVRKGDRVVVTGSLEQHSWQSPQGENRSAIEIRADEIAPSLRWATASVTKTSPSAKQRDSVAEVF